MGRDPVVPAASLHVGRFNVGSQTHGFLTIGVLPLLIATDAQIVFSGEQPDPSALADLIPAFEALAKTSAVEIHQFSLRLAGQNQPVLVAAKAAASNNGQWNLLDVTIAGEHPMKIGKAQLAASGAESGQISFQREGVTQKLQLIPTKQN